VDGEAKDRELLSRWRGGDRVAGNQLFERHFRSLIRFFRNKVDSGVDDLIQETFMACVEGRDRIRDESTFRAYLFGAARFVLYEHVRKRTRSRDFDGEEQSIVDVSPGISTAFAKHREQQLLLNALRMLPLEFQITLELYYWEGLSGPEIAAVLGEPQGTVRKRISSGSDKLRAHVERLEANPDLVQSSVQGIGGWLQKLTPDSR
jgi:RNA polymerase sigma-70 factor (ECF subfamily)